MIYRTLGKRANRFRRSGWAVPHWPSADENEGIRIVRTAVDRGITFMDNCWDYHGEKSEAADGARAARRIPRRRSS